MASLSELPASSRLTMTANAPAVRQPLGCPWVMAARSLPVAKTFESKRSGWRSRLRECAKYMPTGAMRITPPQPLLSLVARVAYVHVPNTGGEGYTSFNRYFFSQVGKDAAIIDERFNEVGQLADYIIDYLRR